MKHISMFRLLGICLLSLVGTTLTAQNWKNMVNKAVDNLTSTTTKDVTGTWTFAGSAIVFDTDNALKDVASNALAKTFTKQLDACLKEIGMKTGTFGYTFATNKNFTNYFKDKEYSGTYNLKSKDNAITLSYGKVLNLIKLNGSAVCDGKTLKLVFPADEMLKFLKSITDSKNSSSLQSLEELIKKNKGVNLGFKLERK
ncbi:MAG: DUF4923 family protein [Bacteroidales bacterium]|nr:DUF4923 family protein [Bacteroidales bacterium]